MKKCMFCAAEAEAGEYGFCLCPLCRMQVCAQRAEHPSYVWFVRAVRRAMFEAV